MTSIQNAVGKDKSKEERQSATKLISLISGITTVSAFGSGEKLASQFARSQDHLLGF